MSLLNLFIQSAFIDNLALAFFLGICTLLGGSRRVSTAFGLGIAVVLVMSVTIPLNHLVYRYLLAPGAWAWAGLPETDLSHLALICFIGVIAALVQILEMVLDRFYPALFQALGVFLPLVTVNCAILGGSLFMLERNYDLTQSLVYGAGSGIGWALAVAAFAAIRERSDVASADASRAFAILAIMSMAYMALSGVQLS